MANVFWLTIGSSTVGCAVWPMECSSGGDLVLGPRNALDHTTCDPPREQCCAIVDQLMHYLLHTLTCSLSAMLLPLIIRCIGCNCALMGHQGAGRIVQQ
jgi:hypothetical protein